MPIHQHLRQFFCHSLSVYLLLMPSAKWLAPPFAALPFPRQPENVLIASDGSAKLSDFGLGALPNSINSENGKLMTTCGTPNYVAPEVLSKSGYEGAPADIWSLGVVLYVVMAGCLPFDEPTLPGLFKQIMQAKYDSPPWFSKELKALLNKMICVDASQRITLEALAADPWVSEGGYTPILGSMENADQGAPEDIFQDNSVAQIEVTPSMLNLQTMGAAQPQREPAPLNAFMLISAAIDLSGMFEQRKVSCALFYCPAAAGVLSGSAAGRHVQDLTGGSHRKSRDTATPARAVSWSR